ncbi:MAG: CHRD domain-containing protein, partial [Pyrinomonadaceae bacterium]
AGGRNMKKYIVSGAALIIVLATAIAFTQIVQSRFTIREILNGYEEVPSVSTGAEGVFRAGVSFFTGAVNYELSYSGLEGSVTQAHIHFGQESVNGAVIIWLCGNAPTAGPPGTQPCPAGSVTISGTITPADVVGQPVAANGNAGQGIQPGEYEEFLRALRAGKTYVNVHTTKFPGGEVRSQIGDNGNGEDDRHH